MDCYGCTLYCIVRLSACAELGVTYCSYSIAPTRCSCSFRCGSMCALHTALDGLPSDIVGYHGPALLVLDMCFGAHHLFISCVGPVDSYPPFMIEYYILVRIRNLSLAPCLPSPRLSVGYQEDIDIFPQTILICSNTKVNPGNFVTISNWGNSVG